MTEQEKRFWEEYHKAQLFHPIYISCAIINIALIGVGIYYLVKWLM